MSPKTAAHLIPVEEPAETPFYIAATQQGVARPARVLKYGDTFIVLDSRGDISATSGGSAGLFHLDTRYLSRLELLEAEPEGSATYCVPVSRAVRVPVQ